MANIARIKEDGKVEYLLSVNTPDYPDGLVNPDISEVEGHPMKYWKIENGLVKLMSPVEILTVDDIELQTRKNLIDSGRISTRDLLEVLIVIGNTQWANGKTVTKTQVIQALKDKIT